MPMNVAQLEEYRRKHFPECPPVLAYLSTDRMDWHVLCPYCGLHHQHSANGGDPSSAGVNAGVKMHRLAGVKVHQGR
jgi:hypothetical protein